MTRALGWMTRLVAVLVIGAASTGAAVLVAPAAEAATLAAPTHVVQFSTDGIHWSDSYSKQLFGDVRLIPNSSALRSLYVRNGATEAGILRITLAQVTTNNIDYANALSISSSTAGAPGAVVPVSAAQPCYTLAQGVRLASGDSVRVDSTAYLGNLNGSAGQTGQVSFQLLVSFSSTDVGAPLPNDCPSDYGTVDTFSDPTGDGVISPASTRPGVSQTIFRRTAAGWTPTISLGATVTPGVQTPTTPVVTPTTPLTETLVSNTGRFYQEYDVAFWLAMSVLGWGLLLLVRRVFAVDQPKSPRYDQNGNRR